MSQTPAHASDRASAERAADTAGDARRRLDRATAELRRGAPVLLTGPAGALLVLAAEEAGEAGGPRLRDLSGRAPALAVTAQRARVLGLDVPEGAAAVELSVRSDSPERTARALLALADPTAPAARSLPQVDGVKPADATSVQALGLAKLARLLPACLVAPLAPADGRAAADAAAFARDHDLVSLPVETLAAERARAAADLHQVAEARVPLEGAEDARVHAFRPRDGGAEHLAIAIGALPAEGPALVRLHSECFTGDLLGSLRCDCGDQLRGAIHAIAEAGGGVLLYLAQEGRGIGLVNKLRAYRLQDAGVDTLDANIALGFDADERSYLPAAEMLRQLGVAEVRLLTNNPDKVDALAACGIPVRERVPHAFPSNGHNERYLQTKASRFGHRLD
jgi:GTP cyclohydrolase II